MNKIIPSCIFLISFAVQAGPYADIAKAKFESEVTQALQLTDVSTTEKNKAISRLPEVEKMLRGIIRDGLKEKKSCLKIKRDFLIEQKKSITAESSKGEDFDSAIINASADYIATMCLDMK